VNPNAPPLQAAKDRIAERFGEFSEGLAANGGGGRVAALLIELVNLIIQALLSIAEKVPAAAAPGEAKSPPPSGPEKDQTIRPGPPHPKGRPAGKPRNPAGTRPSGPSRRIPGPPAIALRNIPRPGALGCHAGPSAGRRSATAHRGDPEKIRLRSPVLPYDLVVTFT
jgi:hypothetical protein